MRFRARVAPLFEDAQGSCHWPNTDCNQLKELDGMSIIREAVALFDDPERLEQAVSALQGAGFDRADLSFLAHTVLERRPDESLRLAESASTPREAPITQTDIRQQRLLHTSMAATIAAFAAAGFAVATGGATALAAAVAVAAAGGAGAAGALIGARLGNDEAAYFGEQLARGGVLLWVRPAGPDAEARAAEILRRYSTLVVIHEFSADGHETLPSDLA
jgi:hypothetical protein